MFELMNEHECKNALMCCNIALGDKFFDSELREELLRHEIALILHTNGIKAKRDLLLLLNKQCAWKQWILQASALW